MNRKLVPVLLGLGGLGVGLGAGAALRPAADMAADAMPAEMPAEVPDTPKAAAAADHGATDDGHAAEEPAEAGHDDGAHGSSGDGAKSDRDYVKFTNQFVIPVIEQGRVAALVVLSLGLEVSAGLTERVYALEPKLRDAMLRVLFDHANAGGFSGAFTDGLAMEPLRAALLESAVREFGPDAKEILIIDVVRQDN